MRYSMLTKDVQKRLDKAMKEAVMNARKFIKSPTELLDSYSDYLIELVNQRGYTAKDIAAIINSVSEYHLSTNEISQYIKTHIIRPSCRALHGRAN